MSARIFSPAKTAMQSGKAKTGSWVLEYEPEKPRKIDPLMGYTSSGDMKSQIKLVFDTKEEAIAYAEKHGIAVPPGAAQGSQAAADFLRGEFPL